MILRRPRRTPSTRGGRVTGTPRARRKRKGPSDLMGIAEQQIKAYQTKARSDKASKARSTPTPKAKVKLKKSAGEKVGGLTTVKPRPDVRPTKLGSVTGAQKVTTPVKARPMSQDEKKAYLKKMKKAIAEYRASRARSTPTPKAPTRKTRTATSPTRSTPTSVRKSRRPTVRVRNPMRRR